MFAEALGAWSETRAISRQAFGPELHRVCSGRRGGKGFLVFRAGNNPILLSLAFFHTFSPSRFTIEQFISERVKRGTTEEART